MDEHPLLRPVEAFPVQQDGKTLIYMRDPAHFAETLVVTPAGYFVLAHFDGRHSLVDVQEAYAKRVGQILPSDELQKMVEMLDRNYFLYNQIGRASCRERV